MNGDVRVLVFALFLLSCSAALALDAPTAPPAISYEFGNPGGLPLCANNPNCVALCTVNAGGTAWQCLDNTSDAGVGTVTQGTGTGYRPTPFGRFAMNDVTAAQAPRLVAASLNSIWKGDHTLVFAGYSTANTNASFQHWAGFDDGARAFYLRQEGSNLVCLWFGPGTAQASLTASGINGWAVTSCRRSGNNHFARVNGSDSLAANASSITADVTAGTPLYMGDRGSGGLPLRGPLAFVAVYNKALSGAELADIENAWWGLPNGLYAPLGTGLVGIEGSDGGVDMYSSGSSIVTAKGLRTTSGPAVTSYWAADQLDVSSWTAIGTPTATTNVSAGPLYQMRSQNECDLVVDDDAAAFEGYQSTGSAYAALSTRYTASCLLKAGTSGATTAKARLVVVTDGAGSVTCDFSDLTSSAKRKTCTATVSGSPSYVRGQILVGNGASDTGSVTVCQCQLNRTGWAELITLDNVLKGSGTGDIAVAPWPSASLGGKYEVLFSPVFDANVEPDSVDYLLDAYNGTDHAMVAIFGYQLPGRAFARFSNVVSASSFTEFITPGIGTPIGRLSAMSMEWRPQGNGKCNLWHRYNTCPSGSSATCTATVVLNSVTNGTGWCPQQPSAVKFGNRYDSSFPTPNFYKALRVYR